jgi:hypothetical protein
MLQMFGPDEFVWHAGLECVGGILFVLLRASTHASTYFSAFLGNLDAAQDVAARTWAMAL